MAQPEDGFEKNADGRRGVCLACRERYDRDLAVSLGTELPDDFCSPECERDYRRRNGPFAPRERPAEERRN